MSSSRYAARHIGSLADSLCKIFGITNASRQSLAKPSRQFSQLSPSRIPQSSKAFTPSVRTSTCSTLRRTQPTFRRTHQPCRPFSSTKPTYAFKTVEEARSRGTLGVLKISPFQALVRGLVFILTGAAIIIYFREERSRMERKKIAEQTKGIGRPKVGGPFNLIDHDGKPFTEKDLKGKYALVYFGFTHCPDICPDELDKMADMIDKVKAECGDVLIPVMISCDPARDKPSVLKPYLKEFHDDIIGLTGDYDEIKKTCKVYRVYFSTPPTLKAGQDYLVDHSIYFYLMDPEGDFVEAIGRNFTADQAARVIRNHVKDWDKPLDITARRLVEAKPVAA
ncbi:protein sco1 [Venturia nashicola]|uniref:Protein sco1 n=1 Tax=Venturia nashicola TaxID=86259 RepID=A0A4Z1P0V8_9PEZI|nr:protein sco1 [Venturia nashicola]